MADLIVDASIAAAWCFPKEQTPYTIRVLSVVSMPTEALAPRLWAYEIRNSVLMGVRRERITKGHAQSFLDLLQDLPIRLMDPRSYDAVFTLAEINRLTVYDAAYLDLALREGLPLASLDGALNNAANKSGVSLFRP
jgi:predicted nucleic acid-binding protein